MNDATLAEHMKEDARFQEEQRRKNDEMLQKIGTLATKEDIEKIVEKIIQSLIQKVGKRGYAGLLIIAGIIGAIVVIGGGLKSLLGWLGFNLMK